MYSINKMISESLDIVQLIERNPITRLNGTYKGKLINKIKEKFTESQQQLYAASFYCFLNYDSRKDFVVDLDDAWRWIGFNRINDAKRLLVKFFVEDVDYVITNSYKLHRSAKQKNDSDNRGGHNKEQIMLTVHTFKKFCLKARTTKADEIHEYYIQLEEIVQELENEKSNEMRLQFQSKINQLEEKIKDNIIEFEQTLIRNSRNFKLVYIGLVEEGLVKFGHSTDIERRVREHKYSFNSFTLMYTICTKNHIDVEKQIKIQLKDRLVQKEYNGKNQTELIQLDESFTIKDLHKEIVKIDEKITKEKEDKYKNLLKKHNEVVSELNRCKEYFKKNNIDTERVFKTTPRRNKKLEFELVKKKYLGLFMENFIKGKKPGEKIWIDSKILFKQYSDFVKTNYESIFVFTKEKFNTLTNKCLAIEYIKKRIDGKRPGGKQFTVGEILTDWINELK